LTNITHIISSVLFFCVYQYITCEFIPLQLKHVLKNGEKEKDNKNKEAVLI